MTISLADLPIEAAFDQLGTVANIEIKLTPAAIEAIPYGRQTNVNVSLDEVSVRMGLQAICSQLGLVFAIVDDHIEIQPTPSLRRLGRSGTWEEIDTLTQLDSTPWSDKGREAVQARVRFSGIADEHAVNWKRIVSAVNPNHEGSTTEALDEACDALGWTWYPQGDRVAVLPKPDQVRRQLERTVSIHAYAQPLAHVLRDLSRKADVSIEVSPEAGRLLPTQIKNRFTLIADGVTIKEAIIEICLVAELTHEVQPNRVLLKPSNITGPPSQIPIIPDRVVGRVTIPNQNGTHAFEWFIRESDLTQEENKKRKQQIERAIQGMKADLAK